MIHSCRRLPLLFSMIMLSVSLLAGNGTTVNEETDVNRAVRSEVVRGINKWDLSSIEKKLAVACVVFSVADNGSLIVHDVISDDSALVTFIKMNLTEMKVATAVPADKKYYLRMKFRRV